MDKLYYTITEWNHIVAWVVRVKEGRVLKLADKYDELDYGGIKSKRLIKSLDRELAFTKVYIENENEHPYIRELKCLQVQSRNIFLPMKDGCIFAGSIDRMEVGIDPERGNITDAAYFCHFDKLEEFITNIDDDEYRKQVKEMSSYWKQETTYFKCRDAFDKETNQVCPDDNYYSAVQMSYPMYGFGGPCLNYDKLLKLGVQGLSLMVKEQMCKADSEDERAYLRSLEGSLQLFAEIVSMYYEEAMEKCRQASDSIIKGNYSLIARSLKGIIEEPPKHYHEAIQLVWLYSLISLTRNYGRMDNYLGDFLQNDITSGYLTQEEAFRITCGLWDKIIERTDNFNNRIIIGGRGRKNEEAADLFASLALKVQEKYHDTIPQLSFRWYQGMNPDLWNQAFDTIAAGSTFPIFYNDDINIRAVQKALLTTAEDAEQYVMYGCGEYLIDHKGIGSPDAALNVLKVLDVTLHDGTDPHSGLEMGLKTGEFESFQSFDELQKAFQMQIDYQISQLAKAQDTIYKVTGKIAAFPFISLLYDDCIIRRRPILNGGVVYRGGTLESFGNNTAADALYSIKKLVYDEKKITAGQLLKCLQLNFHQCEEIVKQIKDVVKYGNDNQEADDMSLWINNMISSCADDKATSAKLHSFKMVLINNGDSILFGKGTGATADGRLSEQPLSNGNQPGAGNDKSGVTALLNSMVKLDPSRHAGVTNNLKLSHSMLKRNRAACQAMIKAYFKQGGTQLMLTVVDSNELEQAMIHPQKYENLIVRVGGYSERFVELPDLVKQEVLKRTLYDS